MTQPQPSKYDEIEGKLGEPLAAYVTERRKAGASWRDLAAEIHNRTEIRVSYEALRVWHQGIPARGAA
jgi:hypothetical protein